MTRTAAADGLSAVILAAGRSQRMGRCKPLLPLDGQTVVEVVVGCYQSAGIPDIRVVVGHRSADVRNVIKAWRVAAVENPDYADGMFTSVLRGVQSLPPGCRAFFIHPVDIPLVRPLTIQRLASVRPGDAAGVFRPVFNGRRGHPPLIDAGLATDILNWKGGGGLAGFLRQKKIPSREVPVADEGILLDLDTPEDYRRLRARMQHRDVPTAAECHVMMAELRALPATIIRHCRAVAAVAAKLGSAVQSAGVALELDLIAAAALLHDIARLEEPHARVGAELLRSWGFARVAEIVRTHMDIEVDERRPVDEKEIVHLADKLVSGAQPVALDRRFAQKMEKYGGSPQLRAAIRRRWAAADRIRAKVEQATGRSVETILRLEPTET